MNETRRVLWDPATVRDLRKIGRAGSERIREAVCTRLAKDPFAGKRLRVCAPVPLYRFRVGDYGVVYMVRPDDRLLLILKIGHRREVYRYLR